MTPSGTQTNRRHTDGSRWRPAGPAIWEGRRHAHSRGRECSTASSVQSQSASVVLAAGSKIGVGNSGTSAERGQEGVGVA